MSLYKDGEGYLNFDVIDKKGRIYKLSSDVQTWKAGESHQIAVSWKMNTVIARDEIHMFVDGYEVPNLYTWGTVDT
jgi:hypothetical protein